MAVIYFVNWTVFWYEKYRCMYRWLSCRLHEIFYWFTNRKKNRKEIIKSLEDCVLSNTTKSNLKDVDFLEVFFNWTKNTSTPYIKPSDIPLKINSLKPSRNYLNTDCKFRQNKNLQVKYCLKATSGYMNMH